MSHPSGGKDQLAHHAVLPRSMETRKTNQPEMFPFSLSFVFFSPLHFLLVSRVFSNISFSMCTLKVVATTCLFFFFLILLRCLLVEFQSMWLPSFPLDATHINGRFLSLGSRIHYFRFLIIMRLDVARCGCDIFTFIRKKTP